MLRKFLFYVFMVFSASAVWANDDAPQINSPIFRFGAKYIDKDISYWLYDHTEFSSSRPKEHFCWEILNLPNDMPELTVRQILIAPQSTQFTSHIADESDTSTGQQIVNDLTIVPHQGHVGNCGHFEAQDPIGAYQMSVEMPNHLFPTQTFFLK